MLESKTKKMAQFGLNWSRLRVCDVDATFVDDLIRLSQIKQELTIPNLAFSFL